MTDFFLAEFIDRERRTIVAQWEVFARTQLPEAAHLPGKSLRDHADEILDAIVKDLKSYQSDGEGVRKSHGEGTAQHLEEVGKLHAAQRFASGFKIGQLVAEYRALRASVLHLWEKNAAQDPRGITRFNEAIDEALTESVNFFADSMTQLRDRFIGVLGHDLRNPLVAIILGSSMMVEAEGISDKNSGMAARILGSARRMQRLVSGLHDLTRTRFGDLVSINPGHMDFAEVCRQVIAEFEVIVPEKKLNFSAKGNLKGIWDPFRLAQVMSNLIDNAVKYGSPRQGIDISVEEQGAEVVVKVHNRGNPIPSEAQGTIFEPMVTLEQPEKGMRRGLGLGLYIVAQIMLAHGGSVAVSSTRKEGTTFTLRLPRGG